MKIVYRFFRKFFARLDPRVVILLLAIVGLAEVVRVATIPTTVMGISMEPGIQHEDQIIAVRWSAALQRGMIVVIAPWEKSDVAAVKRVIGLPGDQIRYDGISIYVNGEKLTESYPVTQGGVTGTWVVPAESIFVMGDNRPESDDSRLLGSIPRGAIEGVAFMDYRRWLQVLAFTLSRLSAG